MIRVDVDGQMRQVNGRVEEIIRLLMHPPVTQRISAPSKGKAIINFGGNLNIEITETYCLKELDEAKKD